MKPSLCPHCGSDHDLKMRFCPMTGHPMNICPNCDQIIEQDWNICVYCGYSLSGLGDRESVYQLSEQTSSRKQWTKYISTCVIAGGILLMIIVSISYLAYQSLFPSHDEPNPQPTAIILSEQVEIKTTKPSVISTKVVNITPTASPTKNFTYFKVWNYEPELDNGEFLYPSMVDIDKEGNIYITDPGLCSIQVFNVNGEFIHRWGGCGIEDNEFSNIEGIAIDNNGLIYIVDKYKGVIQVYQPDGTFVNAFGDLNYPSGIAIDDFGNIFVVEQGKDQVVKFSMEGTLLTKWGMRGEGPSQFDFRNGLNSGIGVDSAGYVYIPDMANNRIQKFDSNGEYVHEWKIGINENNEDSWPTGLSVSQDDTIFVVSGELYHIYVYDTQGKELLKFGERGDGSGCFQGGYKLNAGIAVSESGDVVITDPAGARVNIFNLDGISKHSFGTKAFNDHGELLHVSDLAISPTGMVLVTDSGHGTVASFTKDGKYSGSWQLNNSIAGLDTDEGGNIYIFDRNSRKIYKLDSDGRILLSWGGSSHERIDGKAPHGKFNAQCWGPMDLSVINEQIFVADTCDSRVQVFDLDGTFLDVWNNDSHISRPTKIESDANGNLYIITAGDDRINVFSSSGRYIKSIGNFQGSPLELENPIAIDVGLDGKIYVGTESRKIYILSKDGHSLTSWKIDESIPYRSSDMGLAIDSEGSLYVSNGIDLSKYQINLP